MRPTHLINVTGRRDFTYTVSHKTDIAATFRRVQRELEQSWTEAHAEYAEREKTPGAIPIKKRAAK